MIQQISQQQIKNNLREAAINGTKAYDYFAKNIDYLLYDHVENYSTKSNIFSRFCGFVYDAVQNDAITQPYLNHIKEVICDNNNDVYEYIMNWLACIIQNPIVKTGTVIVVIGG